MREDEKRMKVRKKTSGPVLEEPEHLEKGKRPSREYVIGKLLAGGKQIFLILIVLAGWTSFLASPASAQTDIETATIDRYIQTQMDSNNIPGLAVAIVKDNRIVYSKGYGTTGSGRQVTADTPLPVASLSKSFTALAVMQLVEAGKVRLDDPVTAYIPSFHLIDPRGSKITVRQLLNQTSGLADTVFPEMAFHQQPGTLDEAIARMKNVRLASDPGQKFHYHNPNYQILARVVEAASEESFSAYLQNHIFAPLQMKDTTEAASTRQFGEPGHIIV